MMVGVLIMGTAVLGLIGLPFFWRGMQLQWQAQKAGLSVRPIMVTLIGYLVGLDAALNTLGWALDFIGNHTLLARVFLMAWGNMFDGGYFWHYNELWIGGATAPGEKAWVVALLPLMFAMRIAAAIGFLQMKSWGDWKRVV